MNYRTDNPYLACNGSLCRTHPFLSQFEMDRATNPYLACNGSLCRTHPLLGQFEPFWPWKDAALWGNDTDSYNTWMPLPVGFTSKKNVAPPDGKLADDVYHYIDAKPHHFINFDTGKPYTYVQNKEMGEFWSQLFEATDSSPEELLWNINEYIRQNCSGAIDKEYMSAEVPWNIVCGLSQPAPTPQPAPNTTTPSNAISEPSASSPAPTQPTSWTPTILGVTLAATIGLLAYSAWRSRKTT